MEYRVRLDQFEGPLHLLLHLIEKNEVDIYDIPVAVITAQYLEYLADAGEVDLENLADFLVMAATLLSIKARMLFPQRQELAGATEEKEDDPREELVQKLVHYQKYKALAGYLASRYEGEEARVFYREAGVIEGEEAVITWRASLPDLMRAFRSVWAQKPEEKPYVLPQGDIDVREKMNEIRELLRHNAGKIFFEDVFAGAGNRREALALFLALLELVRLRRVRARQEQAFGQIKIVADQLWI